MKTFNMIKNHFQDSEITSDKGFLLQFFKVTMNLAPIGVLCIFGNQYNMGRVLFYSVILKSKLLRYLMLVSLRYSLDFCVCDVDVDVEFLFLFGETSANT